MSTRTMGELLADLDRIEKLLRASSPASRERHEASIALADIFEEFGKRVCAALGLAFSATLFHASESNVTVAMMLGSRLLTELRRHKLEVIPIGEVPPI